MTFSTGNLIASGNHLKLIVRNHSKDQHQLTETDINGSDSMNYAAVEKMFHERVSKLLELKISNSKGTVLYLKIMKNAVTAFTDLTLTPLERIRRIWYSAFFLRGWRMWVSKTTSVKMENFVTPNAYNCIELNAHSMIILIIKLADDPSSCLIPICNSQHCESYFRFLRSMTSTLCTVVNFTMLDVLNRLRRVALEEELSCDLKDIFIMPHKSSKLMPPDCLPNLDEIAAVVEDARLEAVRDLESAGIVSDCFDCQSYGVSDDLDENYLIELQNNDNSTTHDTAPEIDPDVVDDLQLIVTNCPNALTIPHLENAIGKFLECFSTFY
jgi:hypothetical protein